MYARRILRLLGILILLVSLALLIWGMWPFGTLVQVLPISPSDLQLPTPQAVLPAWIWLV